MSLFSQYHQKFITALHAADVRFLIIGGQAAIYYGVRRGTGDLDILLEPSPENGKRVLRAFRNLKLEVTDLAPEEFNNPLFLGIGFDPDAVDIFTITPGIEFHKAYANALDIALDTIRVKIISLDDLIINKENLKRGGEKQLLDEYDVAVLKKIKKEREA